MIRKLKSRQRHGCDYCRAQGEKTLARWRSTGFTKIACEAHKGALQAYEAEQERLNSYQTEAEFQLGV